jgi:cytochrome c biogenesis protein CcdA
MGLSFLRGMLAAVNPCAFILLPTYLMFFLGMEGQRPGTQRASITRALVVSASVSAGFMAVFVSVGLVSYHFTNWINQNAKYATAVIGAGLVVLGVAMLGGYKLPIGVPRVDAGGRTRGLWSMFVYGIAYAVASIGCTIGLFLPTLFATRRDGVLAAIGHVAAYALGMALLVTALTVSLAVANTGLLKILRTGMQYVDRIAAVFIVLSGLYLLYYFWVVDINEEADPITSAVERFQTWIVTQLDEHWQVAAVVLGGIVVAAIAYVFVRRPGPEPGSIGTAGHGEAESEADHHDTTSESDPLETTS